MHSWGCPPNSNTACSRRLWPSGRHCRAGDWEGAWWRRRSRSARSRKEWLPSEEEPGGNTVINSNVFELVLVDKEAEQEEENVEWCCWGARVVGKRLCCISEGGDILLVDMDIKIFRELAVERWEDGVVLLQVGLSVIVENCWHIEGIQRGKSHIQLLEDVDISLLDCRFLLKGLLFKEFLWLVVLEDDVQALLSDRVLEYVIIEKNFELVSKKKWMMVVCERRTGEIQSWVYFPGTCRYFDLS